MYKEINQEAERKTVMTIAGMCQAADVCRAGFYRHRNEAEAEAGDMDLRDEIQKIALRMPS